MDGIRYIHAADLHLDTPFLGLSHAASGDGRLTRLLHEATFTALERLFRLCETDRPDFLVLAGDIYNAENHSVRAQLKLCEGCRRLADAGVRVFLAHGNHDPLSSRLAAVQWPDNVTIFGPQAERHPLEKDGRVQAVIHGISHAGPRESRNLAGQFHRDAAHDCFQLGVLHCAVEGRDGADRYAPCSLDDLRQAGLDAWALGHVHERAVLARSPFVAYSGSTQGLHVNETGPRGCLRVTAVPAPGGGYACQEEFVRLGPVQWAHVEVDLEGLEHLDEAEQLLTQSLEREAEGTDPGCKAVLARVRLRGRTGLDSLLRAEGADGDLLERLTHLQAGTPGVWVTDLRLDTAPAVDAAACLRREDLLGETLRLAQGMEQGGGDLRALADEALKPLYAHAQLRKVLPRPDDDQLRTLLREARRLCMDILEAR